MTAASETSSNGRTRINAIKHPEGDAASLVGQEVMVKGWVKTVRSQKTFTFVELNDGSSLSNLQVVIDQSYAGYIALTERLTTGSALEVVGKIVESPGKGQALELHATKVTIVGECPADGYPLQKKRHTFEYLRTIAHLRPRTNTLGAVARVRSRLAAATHRFFQEKGFVYLTAPIITGSDCEGAGEMFRVTTLDPEAKQEKKEDFFGRPTFLTVSGQMEAEIYSSAMGDVYTFGPTFRAENSNTSRHLAEFWMVEPEMAFCDLAEDMDNAEAYIQYVIRDLLENAPDDLAFFNKFIDKELMNKLEQTVNEPFERMTYTYAVRVLERSKKKFEHPISWGSDLQTEHERYIAEEYVGRPVFVTDYPKEIKAFYMRDNDDGKTVAAMDLLVPRIGELIGGSQREERLEHLQRKLASAGLSQKDYWWYLELRKFGSVPHAGYGVGFERLVQFATGMENIRDVIPFPRYPGHAEF